MKIQSKLKELQCNLFSIDTETAGVTTCIEEKIELKDKSWGAAKAHILYGRSFCVMQTVFDAQVALTDLFCIEGAYIQLSYLINGAPKINPHASNAKLMDLGKLQLCFSENKTVTFQMNANQKSEYICVLLSKDFFLQLFKNESWYCSTPFYNAVTQNLYSDFGKLHFPLNYSLHQLTHQLFTTKVHKSYRNAMFQLKFKELFLHISNIELEKGNATQLDISEDMHEKIRKVHAYITLHFEKTPTLKELARMAILNELQLKTGFKKIYGVTIRAYIIQLKMERSKSLLARYSVNETAAILGYKSVSHFIQSFKKFYGATPKQAIT